MMKNKKDKKLMGAGVVTAIAASLCCITPILALFAGAGGIASTFSWIEPFRPYLIWITILVLAFAWYQKLKSKKQEIDCACDEKDKPSFWQSKLFLGIVTVFAGLMLAFPHYSYIFYPEKKAGIIENVSSTIQELNVQVKGMTCQSCNLHVENEVAQLPGYIDANADYKTGNVTVKYDTSKSTEEEVIRAINNTGYKIVNSQKAANEPVGYSRVFMKVKGMTCESCNLHVEHEVSELPGYIDAKADYKTGMVEVKYNSLKSSKKDVIEAVNSTGYKVVDSNVKVNE